MARKKEIGTGVADHAIVESVEHDVVDSLNNAKANWYFGEWNKLIELDIKQLDKHPDVAKFAALKAAGYQQENDLANCKKYIQLAKKLGCGERDLAKILIAGVYNTLGRVRALASDDDCALSHFGQAVELDNSDSSKYLARQARSVKELARLGLLPQAAKLIENESKEIKSLKLRTSEYEARQAILDSQIDLINHELSLAHQKSQLYSSNKRNTKSVKKKKIDIDRLRQLSPSQLGQDLWVLEKTNYKRKGFFVEFGATDGILLSNTYLLEKEFDWRGICAEPNPVFFKKLQLNRDCIASNACIAAVTGDKVDFILADEYGGIDGISTLGRHREKVKAYKAVKKTISMETISLEDFLLEQAAPKIIDYLSIDTEGSEYIILEHFPFDKWDIKLITVEHNYEKQRMSILELLKSYGYKCIKREWDDWYIKP